MPPADALRFKLPLPPSANALWTVRRGTKQRIKTDAYRAWIVEAGWLIVAADWPQPTMLHGSVAISIEAPFSRRRDLDNAIKPILDLIVRHGLIEDDRWVDYLLIRRVPPEEALTVALWKL